MVKEVSGYNQFDPESGYSGTLNKPITAIRISGNLPYRVHIKDGNWLSPVTGYSKEKSQEDYIGNGKIIGCISIKGEKYMVHVMGGYLKNQTIIFLILKMVLVVFMVKLLMLL